MQIAALAAGVLILAAPAAAGVLQWLLSRPAKSVPTYRDAIAHLADVRSRLVATQALGDDQKKAIDILTLALVDGSDL